MENKTEPSIAGAAEQVQHDKAVSGRKKLAILFFTSTLTAGSILGYSVARIEMSGVLVQQDLKYSEEMNRTRSYYGLRIDEVMGVTQAQSILIREVMSVVAEQSVLMKEMSQQMQEVSNELGMEPTRAARRAADAARKAKDSEIRAAAAEERAVRIIEERTAAPVQTRPMPAEPPKWLDGP